MESAGLCGSPESSGAVLELPALGETLAVMVTEERETLTPESFITMVESVGTDSRRNRIALL